MRLASRLVLVALLALAMPACGGCGKKTGSGAADAAASTAPAPVPMPEGLLAEGWVRAPDAFWARVQNAVSGAAALLPPDAGSLACSFAGLDAKVASLVDGKATAYFVVADPPPGREPAVSALAGQASWAVALALKDSAQAAGRLFGDAGALRARAVEGMRVLVRGDNAPAVGVAVAPGWLVLADDDEDLARLGPYAWRTMPTRPAPASSAGAAIVARVPHDVLAGRVSSALAGAWGEAKTWLAERDREERARHGGRAPDFGDPQAILSAADAVVQRRIALVAGASSARIEIDAGEDDVRADVFVTPGATGAGAELVASMHPGDVRPLGQVPGQALAALLTREDAAERLSDAHEAEAALSHALGPRLRDEDARAADTALEDWAAGRGDWMTLALAWGSRGVWARAPADGDGAARAVREAVDLLRRPVFSGPLRRLLGVDAGPTIAHGDVDGVVDASVAALGASRPPSLGVAWGARDGDLLVAAGDRAADLLSAEAAPRARMADDPRVARVLSGLGADATLALLAEPLRLDPARAGSDAARAPVVLAWGRRGGEAWARVDAAGELLRELVRLRAGF